MLPVVSLLIPLMSGISLVLVFQPPLTARRWAKLTMILGISLLFFICFVALGLLISASSKRPSVSFLMRSPCGCFLF
jgi:ABC-type Mn2+/Zn2+ transport system permease subunit